MSCCHHIVRHSLMLCWTWHLLMCSIGHCNSKVLMDLSQLCLFHSFECSQLCSLCGSVVGSCDVLRLPTLCLSFLLLPSLCLLVLLSSSYNTSSSFHPFGVVCHAHWCLQSLRPFEYSWCVIPGDVTVCDHYGWVRDVG